jgi:Heterokaryon incompatibility protein (HET)
MSDYVYTPITPGFTRILHLEPGSIEDPLRGKLVERRVGVDATYIAVSYCWGPPTLSRTILLPEILYITETLHHALHRLRRDIVNSVMIWADAIYINQQSIAERNNQGSYIAQIYANAELVWVDLGPSGDDSHLIPTFCKTASANLVSDVSTFESSLSHKMPSDEDPSWNAWHSLLLRPWFRCK